MLFEAKMNAAAAKHTLIPLVVLALGALAPIESHAVQTGYALGYDSVSIGSNLSNNIGAQAGQEIGFYLDDGGSFTFGVFTVIIRPQIIWSTPLTPENTTISATITLPMHEFASGDTGMNISSRSVTFEGKILFGQSQFGVIVWTTPAQTFTDDGVTFPGQELARRTYTVDLSNEVFAPITFPGWNPAPIKATVTQLSSSTSVPDGGSTAMLLGGSFVTLILAKACCKSS